jgi:hypothetical protein
MKCTYFEKHIGDYLNGALSSEERESFEHHVSRCALCAKEKESLDQLVNTLQEQDIPDPGPSYWDSFNRRVNSQIDERLQRRGWLPLFPLPRWIMATTTAALIVIAAALSYLLLVSESPSLVDLENQIVEKIQEISPDEAEGVIEEMDFLRSDAFHLDESFNFQESAETYANGKIEYYFDSVTDEGIIPYTSLEELEESEASLLIDQIKSEMG